MKSYFISFLKQTCHWNVPLQPLNYIVHMTLEQSKLMTAGLNKISPTAFVTNKYLNINFP